ncbi:undecaprenyldiphospho-muramoylpentapeptide beta-N-acetylglucosaminyltransferase [bacterium]|nr:undecaprenyldiphospho-muramoylpentapeptide beta-N-acetylglucosaminyltransferase [bacterium]
MAGAVMPLRVTFTGGGTGGHLYPGLAIIEELSRRMECTIQYIGTARGIENRIIPETGYRFDTIWMSGIHRGHLIRNLLFPVKMAVSFFQAMGHILSFRSGLVIGTGGYVSWPVMTAAAVLRKPRFIQEQNQQPGLVTKTLSPFMTGVFLSFETTAGYFRRRDHLHVFGNPTRGRTHLTDKAEAYEKFRLDPDRFTLFIFGGSQGARGINEAVSDRIPELMKNENLQILWATGPRWYGEIASRFVPFRDRVRILSYVNDMGHAYTVSDLIVCRSGAGTVAEIAGVGKAALFIPFPGAANAHQESNARVLEEAGAAAMVLEPEIAGGKLDRCLRELISDSDKRKAMQENIRKFAYPEAAMRIVETITHFIKD